VISIFVCHGGCGFDVPLFLAAMPMHACNVFPVKAFKKVMKFFVVPLLLFAMYIYVLL
jgi:hypothetical protein